MKTLLIADDSPHKITLIQSMLVRFGWNTEPLIAMTTEDAMDLIDTHAITHAFIDYYIPSKNGPAIIAKLKATNPAARIILVSSSDNADNFNEAKEAGAEACICTTHSMDEVERVFGDVLHAWTT